MNSCSRTPISPGPRLFENVPPRFVLLDKWGTGWFGPDAEPTRVIYDGLELHSRGISFLGDYLPTALTVAEEDPDTFLKTIAAIYDTVVPEHLYHALNHVVSTECYELTLGRILCKPKLTLIPATVPASYTPNRAGMFEDVRPCLEALRQAGASTSLCTNTWRLCDVRRVLRSYEVDHLFDHVLVSGELRIAKQAGAGFFLRCAAEIGAQPQECVAVDDNLQLGVVPAVLAGMQGVLVDRFHHYTDELGRSHVHTHNGLPKYPEITRHNIQVIHDLDRLPDVLGYRTQRVA